MINCDLLIVTAPYTETGQPLQAPAIIKACVMEHGFSARTHDINHDFVNLQNSDKEKFELLKNFFSFGTLEDREKIKIVDEYINETVNNLLLKFNPKYVAVSVFTYQCQQFSEMFAKRIKEVSPTMKIVFGGQGISTQGIGSSNDAWAKSLKARKVIDHFIVSEGEVAIVNLLKHGKGAGVDNTDWIQQLDLERSPLPDYSDYDLDSYEGDQIMITGSRGCVRRCTFCDIHKHWKKFVYRKGQDIANEMIEQSKRYKKYRFGFTDSLINGSMKAYRDFIGVMADYNESATQKISWQGQFIVRGIKAMTEEDWKLTGKAGAEHLSIGVESGSEAVRDHMKKQFSNSDMDEFVEQAYLNKVNLQFLMIVGYPTETYEDFLETLRMFKKYKKYQSIVKGVTLGSTLGVLPGTPLAEEHGHDLSLHGGENFWIYEKNKSLTFKERIKRRIIAGEEIQKMGYYIGGNESQLRLLHFLWGVYKNDQTQSVVDLNSSDVNEQKYS